MHKFALKHDCRRECHHKTFVPNVCIPWFHPSSLNRRRMLVNGNATSGPQIFSLNHISDTWIGGLGCCTSWTFASTRHCTGLTKWQDDMASFGQWVPAQSHIQSQMSPSCFRNLSQMEPHPNASNIQFGCRCVLNGLS